MSERVTVELPEELARRGREVAAQGKRLFEQVLVEWMERGASAAPIPSLTDSEVLALCDGQMPEPDQDELAELLANFDGPPPRNRAGQENKKDK